MKNTIILALLLSSFGSRGQLYIQTGGTLVTTSNAVITIQNTNLVNNGSYVQNPGGKTIFAGTGNDSIMGAAQPSFDTLEIAHSGQGKTILLQHINCSGAVKCTSGILDIHGRIVQLQSNAVLNESATSYVTDTLLGGYITITRVLNAPAAVNPGNLGAILTSAQNMGSTVIRRGHMSQVNGNNGGSSIKRYYDITPSNNTALNATLRILYRDNELNGLAENNLNMWKSNDNINWSDMGYTTRNAVANYVEKTGIAGFSRWTLSTVNNPLPLLITSFQAGCNSGKVSLDWLTEQESNVSHFEVERSNEGTAWTYVASVPFVNATHRYRYADINDKGFYRLAVVDNDGSKVYSEVVQAACTSVAAAVSLWPNPATAQVYISITASSTSQMVIRVHDGKGAVVLQQQDGLLPGDNKITLDLQSLAAGVYWVTMDWENGAGRKSVKVVKQ